LTPLVTVETTRVRQPPAEMAGGFIVVWDYLADRNAFVGQMQVPERLDRRQRAVGVRFSLSVAEAPPVQSVDRASRYNVIGRAVLFARGRRRTFGKSARRR
jgi:hypothetical protein